MEIHLMQGENMSKQQVNQQEQKKIESVKEIVSEKKEPRYLGACSFSKATKEMMKIISSKTSGDYLKFEEKKTGEIYEIKVEIKKTPAEIFTDEKGKTWKRIA